MQREPDQSDQPGGKSNGHQHPQTVLPDKRGGQGVPLCPDPPPAVL